MTRFCIILGAMKAGTTSLFNYLAQHPEIAPCSEKEPNFFSHHYQKGTNWYFSLWGKQDIQSKVLLEASTNYTKYPSFSKSSENMLDFFKKQDITPKLIYVMRDPIKRIESQYTYSFARWTSDSLEERLKHGHIIHVSRYAQQLDHYWEKFHHDDFLLLDFDDLIKRPNTLLETVCDFLSIDSGFKFSNLGDIHNKSEGKIITKPIDRLYLKYPYLKAISKIFPKSIKTRVGKILFRRKIIQKFELTQEQQKMVYEELKEDLNRLHDKYHIDIKKWGF